jgi:hypothetical protein
MDQSGGDFPSYYRDWENYPSGRRFERVTRLEKKGRHFSVTKVTDPDGLVEYSLTIKYQPVAGPSFVEFATATFGRTPCGRAVFDAMQAEMMALCTAGREDA